MTYKPVFKFVYPCFQLNFEKSWWDYYSVSFFFPFFESSKFREEMDVSENTIYAINAPTTLSFVNSDIHRGFKIQLLGFGIGLLRQNGY